MSIPRQVANKTIFVASSQEARGIAERIVRSLGNTGELLPVPWWDAFQLSKYTFDELNRQSRSVDGALFLATNDDKVWYRDNETTKPRDNVIFELGLFANRLGLSRIVIAAEQGVNLPTDLLGVTYQRLESNKVEATAEAVALHFAKEFEKDASDDPFAALRVICHPDIASLQVSDKLPFDWLMRAMYLGTEGARAWLNIAADPTSSDIERDLISGTIKEMLNASPSSFRTYVSLGPGDANLDKAVAVQLLRKEPTAQCIPVDLSDGLLWVAIRSLSERIRVPIGLLADFEANFKFVTQRVREYSKGPYLYGMFGNTFGNLDRVERDFIGQMRDYLAPEDELIMDVSVVKSGKATNGNLWKSPGKKRFFAHGAARLLGTSAEDVLENFRDIIKVKRTVTNNPIAHTQLLTVSANRRPFARVRRYHLGSLIEYFRTEGFETRAKQIPTDGLFDIGVVAIRRKKT